MSVSTRPSVPRTAYPPAARVRRPGWRDPRLAAGLLLVLGSVLAGAKLLAAADDTVPVLVARAPLAAGATVSSDDVATTRLRFASASDADRYLSGGDPIPEGTVLLRPVGAGELLPRSALDVAAGTPLAELPLGVDPARVPAGVGTGAVVDVWVAPGPDDPDPADGPLLSAVPVLSTSGAAATGASGLRQVVVGVPAEEQPSVARVVERLGDDSTLVLVRRPG